MKEVIVIVILISSSMIFGCKNSTKTDDIEKHEVHDENIVEMNKEQCRLANIELGEIENKVLGGVIKVNGTVNVPPQNFISVYVAMGGFVKSTNMIQGTVVAKGEVLATIENSEFIQLQQEYLENKSKLEYSEAEYNRQKGLFNEKVISEKTYQQVSSEYKMLKTKVYSLEQRLALIGIDAKNLKEDKISRSIAITSPIDGYVKSVNINVGKYVSPTDVMFEIVNNSKLTLELTLFEKDINNVASGMKIRFFSPDKSDKEYIATVYQIGKSIGSDRTIKVYAIVSTMGCNPLLISHSIDNDNKDLLPGMYINALIETTNNSVTSLPDDAIVSFDDKNYIFIYNGKRIENKVEVSDFIMMEVKKGVSANGFTELILPDKFDIKSTKVVIKGAYNLLSAKKNAGEMSC